MEIYRFLTNYRGINKLKKGEVLKTENGETIYYPPFHVFKKGDLVNGEPYNPNPVAGFTYPKQMILVTSVYIVPADNLKKLEGAELSQAYAELGYIEQEETPLADNEQIMDVSQLPEEKARIIENLHKSTMMDYGKSYGVGAVIGGIAGFGIAWYMKKNKIIGAIIGVTLGVLVTGVFAKPKDTATENK